MAVQAVAHPQAMVEVLVKSRYVGRLAPSPTGALHLGNARTFLIAWARARLNGGRLILRMEDLDHPKVKSGAAGAAIDDLRWLGIEWDEGPDRIGANGPYTQSERIKIYADAIKRLAEQHRVYPCICSRADVEAAQSAPHEGESLYYPGCCRGRFKSFDEAQAMLPDGRLPVWRFKVEPDSEVAFNDGFCGAQSFRVDRTIGDFALARHRHGAGYMLAMTIDDALMGVSEVVRGDDLLDVTPRQILICQALDLTPPSFCHVPLVVGTDGKRLAKRHGDTRIAELRRMGVSREQILGLLAWWSGWGERGEELKIETVLERAAKLPLKRERAIWDGSEDNGGTSACFSRLRP